MRRDRILFVWVAVVLALLGTSCSRWESISDVQGGVSQVSFPAWCSSLGLQNCDLAPSKPVPQNEWDAALDMTALVLGSPSTFAMSRADFENPHLQSLFHALGAGDVLDIVKSFPWSSLSLSLGKFILSSETSGGVVSVRGVKFRGSQSISIKLDRKKILISGLELVEPKASRVVQTLDLSKTGFVTMITDSLVVQDLPLEFFVPGVDPSTHSQTQADAPNMGEIVKALSELALDKEFVWREKLTFLLTKRELPKLNEILGSLGPRDPVVDSVMNTVASSDHVLFGGSGSENLLSVSRKKAVSCVFHVVDVPIVKTLNLSLQLAPGFGLSRLSRGTGDVLAKIDSYGIETNCGKVKNIEVKADRMIINVGVFRIPVEFTPTSSGKGPRVVDGKCTEN